MSGVYEAYLIRMLAPLGLYDLNGVQNRSELSALGGKLDEVGALLDTVERESLLATAEGEGLDRREALFARKPAALTAEERREAIAALLRIGEDSLTPGAINDTLMGLRRSGQSNGKGRSKPGNHVSGDHRNSRGVRPDSKDHSGYPAVSSGCGIFLPLSDVGRV